MLKRKWPGKMALTGEVTEKEKLRTGQNRRGLLAMPFSLSSPLPSQAWSVTAAPRENPEDRELSGPPGGKPNGLAG